MCFTTASPNGHRPPNEVRLLYTLVGLALSLPCFCILATGSAKGSKSACGVCARLSKAVLAALLQQALCPHLPCHLLLRQAFPPCHLLLCGTPFPPLPCPLPPCSSRPFVRALVQPPVPCWLSARPIGRRGHRTSWLHECLPLVFLAAVAGPRPQPCSAYLLASALRGHQAPLRPVPPPPLNLERCLSAFSASYIRVSLSKATDLYKISGGRDRQTCMRARARTWGQRPAITNRSKPLQIHTHQRL